MKIISANQKPIRSLVLTVNPPLDIAYFFFETPCTIDHIKNVNVLQDTMQAGIVPDIQGKLFTIVFKLA